MANTTIVRCPVCLISQSVASDYPPNKRLHCGNCGRDFVFKNALPLTGDGAAAVATAVTAPNSEIQSWEVRSRSPVITWIIGVLALLIVMKYTRPFMAGLKGPDFLLFYGVLFFAILAGVVGMRKFWEDSLHVTLIGLILYEAVGVLRFFDGYAAGMHKFLIMFVMMGIGGLWMFVRSENVSSGSSSSGCSGFGGCGSSCSGCGGGGGCGGCGG